MHAPRQSLEPNTAIPTLTAHTDLGWAHLSVAQTLAALGSSEDGLSMPEAQRRWAQMQSAQTGIQRFLWRLCPQPVRTFAMQSFLQMADPAHLLMLLCAVAASTLGAPAMAVAIVVLTAIRVGVLAVIPTYDIIVHRQLDQAGAPRIHVRRNAKKITIAATELVKGDIVEFAPGTRIPADLRLLTHTSLVVDQTAIEPSAPMVWANSWVTSGQGVGVVTAIGTEASGNAINRLERSDIIRMPSDPARTNDSEWVDTDGDTPARFALNNANIIVVVIAALVLISGIAQGTEWLHSVLAAIILGAMAWSAQTRLFDPLNRFSAVRGMQRMLASGIYVRNLTTVDRLASVPTSDADIASNTSQLPPLRTAGSDDTDHVRWHADVVFDAPNTDIPRLALKATQLARSARASAGRAWAFSLPSMLALLAITAVQALLLSPAWPASVPLGLQVAVLTLSIALALLPVRGATSRIAREPAVAQARQVGLIWSFALGTASFMAIRVAPKVSIDAATLTFVLFAASSTLYVWLVALTYGARGWKLRRPQLGQLGQPREVVWLLGATMAVALTTLGTVSWPSWQSAFETVSLSRTAWHAGIGLSGAVVIALLVTLWVIEWIQQIGWQHAKKNDHKKPENSTENPAAHKPSQSHESPKPDPNTQWPDTL